MLNSNTFHAMCHAIQAVRLLCAVTYGMYNAFLTQYIKLLRTAPSRGPNPYTRRQRTLAVYLETIREASARLVSRKM